MKKWNTVIFDMDGTLFDTEVISRQGWIEAGKKYNLPICEDFVLGLIGLTPSNAQVIYDTYMPEGWPQQEAYQYHEDYIADYRNTKGIPTKGDLHAVLEEIKKRGYRIAIATSARHENMILNIEQANIKHYFDVMLSAELIEKGKPDPDIYFKTMQAMNVNPQDCVIVEDSFNGVRAAHASTASVVMIPDLLQPTEEIASLCDYQLKDLEELLTIL